MQPQLPQDLLEILARTLDRVDIVEKNLTNDAVLIGAEFNWPASNSLLPFNYLPCDGSALDRIAYAALFQEIGTTYGVGDGLSTFNIPNRGTAEFYTPEIVTWTPITVFGGAWGNFGSGYQTSAFYKDPHGIVHVRGLISRSATYVNGEAAVNLPAGYRPAATEIFNANANQGIQRVDVLTNGDILTAGFWAGAPAGAGFYLSLSSITFDSGSLPTLTANQTGNWVIKVL